MIWHRFIPHPWQLFFALLSMLIGIFGTVIVMIRTADTPINILSIHEDDGIAVAGGRIDVVVHLSNPQICPTRTDRVIWRMVPDPEGGEEPIPKILPLSTGSIVVPYGGTRYIVSLIIPDIEPGDWFYASRTTFDCPIFGSLFGQTIRQSSNVPVKIIKQDH